MGDGNGQVSITFPIHCRYLGGHRALGGGGRHLWIGSGRIGHGAFRLTRSIPLAEVTSVEVSEREIGGASPKLVYGVGIRTRSWGFSHPPKQVTDVVLRTKDGQEAVWEVVRRGEAWVRHRLSVAIHENGLLFYDELRPDQRIHRPGGG